MASVQVASNVPRFYPGKFGQAVMVEEGTTNICNPSYIYKDTWTVIDYGWRRITTISCSAGAVFSISADVRNPSSGNTRWACIVFRDSGGALLAYYNTSIDTSKTRQQYTTPAAPANTASVTIYWVSTTTGRTYEGKNFQIEQKPYATSFTDGTRSPETLTIPTAGVLNPQEGTVECWVYVNDAAQKSSTYSDIFDVEAGTGTGWINLLHMPGGFWRFACYDGVVEARIDTPGNLTIGWHHFAIRWSADGNALFVDGQLIGTTTVRRTPTTLAISAYIGCHQGGTRQLDTLIDDLRISSRARTDEEIAAAYASGKPLPCDEWTTYKLGFDGTLRPTIRKFGMMLKDGEITVTHPTGEYTQMSESGLIHFIPQPIYTTSPLPANTQGFESGSIPSGWVLGSRCSIVSGQARTGTYCLAMIGNDIDSSYWYVDFYVTQDNTTVSFWYRRTSSSSSNWSFGVALDGVYKGSLGHTTSWTQFTITGVSKGMHELRCYAVDVDSYTDTIYFDDFVFEANPVTYNLVGYNPAIGYEHIYGVYIGQYTTNALGVITTSIPQAWIQLPEWMKNKDIKVFLSLTNISYTTTTHLKLLKIDNTVPAFKVEAYAEDQYYNLRPLEFTYFVLV